jgi:hypothetical protein
MACNCSLLVFILFQVFRWPFKDICETEKGGGGEVTWEKLSVAILNTMSLALLRVQVTMWGAVPCSALLWGRGHPLTLRLSEVRHGRFLLPFSTASQFLIQKAHVWILISSLPPNDHKGGGRKCREMKLDLEVKTRLPVFQAA